MAHLLFAEDILDTLRESALILSSDFRVERANTAFRETFGLEHAPVEHVLLWDLSAGWATSALRHLLEDRLVLAPDGTLSGVEIRHDFEDGGGTRTLLLNARRIARAAAGVPTGDDPIFVALDDVTGIQYARSENDRLRLDAESAKAQRDRTLRDVLSAATEGKLLLCLSPDDLPVRHGEAEPTTLSLPTLSVLRRHVRQEAQALGIGSDRIDDFENAVGEAAMNAVLHGGGGTARVCVALSDGAPRLQVWLSDYGKGIPVADLPRAALEKGFSSAGTMGQGFKIILRMADRLYLYTNEKGTTVVLEQEKEPPLPAWLQTFDF